MHTQRAGAAAALCTAVVCSMWSGCILHQLTKQPCACLILYFRAVACGLEHTIAITSKDVLAWGSHEFGQLGHGEHAPDTCVRPMPIKLLHEVMVTQVIRTWMYCAAAGDVVARLLHLQLVTVKISIADM